jgi:hypothetical protein
MCLLMIIAAAIIAVAYLAIWMLLDNNIDDYDEDHWGI